MTEQLALDFSQSATQRQRAAKKRQQEQLTLFAAWAPNIDIHLHSATEVSAHIAGKEPERVHSWLQALVGSVRVVKRNKVLLPADQLDKLAFVRPPARVTLDATTRAIANTLHAQALGCKPLVVSKMNRRVVASSPRGWPTGLKVVDAPWPAIETLLAANVPVTVAPGAEHLLQKNLGRAGTRLGTATLSGNSILLRSEHPTLLEGLNLPALAHVGDKMSGNYRMPLMCGQALLSQPTVAVPDDVAAAVKRVTRKTKPLVIDDPDFPYTLWDFQAEDAGIALRSLQVSGGVLLALSMGAGKTTVSLALAHHLNAWPTLVVAPLSAFSTWARQLEEMGKSFMLATGSPKKCWKQLSDNDYDVYVVSYDRVATFAELLRTKGLQLIIADEIQRIRNPGSGRSRALRAMAHAAPLRIGLSGTPMVNGLGDLLSVGNFLVPGEWPARSTTKKLDDKYPGDPVDAITEHLHSMMVRRRMDQVGRKLAKRVDRRVYVNLTVEQKRAITDLEEEIRAQKEAGGFDGSDAKFNALTKLTKLRAITNCPRSQGVPGPNPKIAAAMKMVRHYLGEGRQGVIFCADLTSIADISKELAAEGVRFGVMQGSTPADERIAVEKKLHSQEIDVVVASISSSAESWSASPSATFLIALSGMYQPAILEQMEARVHRLNSRLEDTVEITYIHAVDSGETTVDDRMLQIVQAKKELASRVIDRQVADDNTEKVSLTELMYMLTGERDSTLQKAQEDRERVSREAQRRKQHARRTLHGRRRGNRDDAELVHDTGEQAEVLS